MNKIAAEFSEFVLFSEEEARALDARVVLRENRTALAPDGHDYWSGILGFHLSHAIGVLLFALLIVTATAHGVDWLKPLLVGVGVVYAAISHRCWFKIPTIGFLVATALMTCSWWVWPVLLSFPW